MLYRIVPNEEVYAMLKADSPEMAMVDFAITMESNMNVYFHAVPEPGWLNDVWGIMLEDDDSDEGGTAFAGETVGDFIESTGLNNLAIRSVDDLNVALRASGIKPIKYK